MAQSCWIVPKINNKKGELVDSKLFKSLLSFTSNNREQTLRLYLTTKNEDFIRDWYPKLTLDSNGEPTLSSLLKNTDFKDIINSDKVISTLTSELNKIVKSKKNETVLPNNTDNYDFLKQTAIDFNNNNDFKNDYVALVEKKVDNQTGKVSLNLKVEKRNPDNANIASNMEYNELLNTKLRNILQSFNISVGALTDLEQRLGVSGVTDFSVAKTATNGIIELIRLANGEEGEAALPEEFAHFAIEALGDNPLISRLVNHLESNKLVKEIIGEEYNSYYTLYQGNRAKLAKEAAGKLLAKHLIKNETIESSSYRPLLTRVIQAVKNFFKNLSLTPFQRALKEADKNFSSLAIDILNGSLRDEMSLSNITESDSYYNVTERVQRDKGLLQKIIDNELKRLKVYEKRNPNSNFDITQTLFINQLTTQLHKDETIEGIYTFLESSLEELKKVSNRLMTLKTADSQSTNEKAKVLRDVRNYYFSYKGIFNDIRNALLEEEGESDNRYGQRVRTALDQVETLLKDLYIQYTKVSKPLFIDFLKPFLGESITIPFGKYKGKVMTAEQLIEVADRDISFFDRWLDSMADSSDFILKAFDQAVKTSKENARLSTIDIMKELQALTIELEQAGINNTEWMFEVDSNGNKTGNYIREINYGLFNEKLKKLYANLTEKYGKNPVGKASDDYFKERQQWFQENTEIIDDERVPKKSIYGNKQFENLTPAQRKYYDRVMEIKEQLDSLLPAQYTTTFNTVKIRKDLIERLKGSKDLSNISSQIIQNIKDNFIKRTDDTDFGEKATLKDFENNKVQSLPIYYTKLKEGESENDVSTDIVATLSAYAAMANDFNEMNKVIDLLELGRDLLQERSVTQTEGDKQLTEKFKLLGRTVESKLTETGDKTRFIQRLNDFFDMQVYGNYMQDEGTFGNSNIDKGKVANFVNRVTALNTLAINVLSGISNIATGTVMMRIESIAGEFFKPTNVRHADAEYTKNLPAFLAEIGSRVKTNKLALWNEYFNVMQEYEQDIKEVNFDRKHWYSRMFTSSSLFFINNAGEHWMQTRTSLALADTYKMKAPDGKTVSLWDAMEVVYRDPNNKALGASLRVKEGYTKEDGSQFTKQDAIAFSKKSAAINERMHGIYNKADRNAFQKVSIGRMGMLFRKWIKPSLNRRFSSTSYNYDLQAWTEGYYNTLGRFLLQTAKELKEGKFALIANYKNLTKTEKHNILRAVTELGHFLILAAVLGLIDWPDDKDRPWLVRMTEYQARRLYTEIGVMIPGPSMIQEGLKIIKSPAAGVNTLESCLDLIGLLNPYNYETVGGEDAILKSGRYKGRTRAHKLFFDSPVLPMNKTIYRGLHPEETIPFFKQ